LKILKPKAEIKAVLSILEGPDEVKLELLNALTEEHFGYRPMHGAYCVISKMLLKSAMDLPTMETFLEHHELDQEAVDDLTTPTSSPIRKKDDALRLCEILEYYRQVRAIHSYLRDQAALLRDRRRVSMDDLIADMETTLLNVRSDVHEEKMYHAGRGAEDSADELVEEAFSSEMPRLVPSTFDNFDRRTGGFGGNDLVILASHMKGGKSIMALNMGVEQYRRHNLDIIYIPLEMSKVETVQRLLSKISTVEHNKIRTKTWNAMEFKQARKAWRRFKNHGIKNDCRFTVWPIASLTISQLRMRLRPMGYTVVIVDYLNLLIDPTNNPQEWLRLSNFARDLKLMTKELDVLIVAPTQMNMDGQIRYSKAIGEHANTVWTWVYGEEEIGTHVITINQPYVRGWAPFKFQMREDFERMCITDHLGGDFDDEDFAVIKNETMKGV
jgi:replicative DNA helicase